METVTFRVRSLVWFATGVVVTLLATLVVGQAWRADAAPGDVDSTFVPMTACRLIDTRPAPDRVGPKATLGVAETTTLQATGTNGNCVVPTDAVGLSMNVTALNATAGGFLTFWPDGVRPLAASLNPSPGQPPVPNAVPVSLSAAGAFNVYNENGTVDIVIDVNGYYIKTSLTGLAARMTAAETGIATHTAGLASNTAGIATNTAGIATNTAGIATNTAGIATNTAGIATNTANIASLDAREPFAVTARNGLQSVTSINEVVVSVSVTAPAAGQVTVNSTTSLVEPEPGDRVRCSITTATTPPAHDGSYLQSWESGGSGSGSFSQLAGTRVFNISAGEVATYTLVCNHVGVSGSSGVLNAVLTAIFTPAP